MAASLNRRQFLKAAAAAAVTGPFIGSSGAASPNQRVRLGFIACGGRAQQMLPMFLSAANTEIAALCDVNEPRMGLLRDAIQRLKPQQKPDMVIDYRSILDRKDVDGVVIATTQHWHGLPHIHAAQAGKAIFVEKPLSHTVVEGRAMVQASKKYGVHTIMGTQQRIGPSYQQAVEVVRSGRLGKISLVECWNYHNTGQRAGRYEDSDPPAGLHWDRWLGPAPAVPYNRARMNNSWWFDYGGGMMTNWAIHHIDIILWAMNDYSPKTVACSGGKFYVDDMADTPDTIEASWEFDKWMMQYSYRGFSNFHIFQSRPNHHGICFHGDKMTMLVDRFGYEIWEDNKRAEPIERVRAVPYFDPKDPMRSEQDGPFQRLFVDSIREGKPPMIDIEHSHKATVCCHLANIAYLTRSTVHWDGATETIANNPAASALLARPRRPGYELPSV